MLAAALVGIAIAEVTGYVVHRLLHHGSLGRLSEAHLEHHTIDFPPGGKQRVDSYRSGAAHRFNISGVGLEWLVPTLGVVSAMCLVLWIVGVTLAVSITVVLSAIVWAIVALNYMHSMMHMRDHILIRTPGIRRWFKGIRRLHDIHHTHLDSHDRMDANFGICIFILDRLFGTFRQRAS